MYHSTRLESTNSYREFLRASRATDPGYGFFRHIASFILELPVDMGHALRRRSGSESEAIFSYMTSEPAFRQVDSELFSAGSAKIIRTEQCQKTSIVSKLCDSLRSQNTTDSRDVNQKLSFDLGQALSDIFGGDSVEMSCYMTHDAWSKWLTGDFDSSFVIYSDEKQILWVFVVRDYDIDLTLGKL